MSIESAILTYIPKVTLKVINQDGIFFADFSVNSQQIFIKFSKQYFSKKSQQPCFRKIIWRISKVSLFDM